MRPATRSIARRGVTNALIAGLIVGVIAAVIVALFFYGKDFFGTIGLGQAVSLGLVAGSAIGAAFFWSNLVILEIGLWFRPAESWAVGAPFATPVILAAVGFGYVSYSAYQAQSQQPTVVGGTVEIVINGQRLGHVTARGSADCTLPVDGGLNIDATVSADNGQQARVQLAIRNDQVTMLALGVGDSFATPGKGWSISDETVNLPPSDVRTRGAVDFAHLVPLLADGEPDPTERWDGALSWSCAAP
jgi:hypothetical protein